MKFLARLQREGSRIGRVLIEWWEENGRDLEWRETLDPYRILVAEIMLQQTRIQTATAYYWRFLEAFPDIIHLAKADTEQVLRLWAGLGYYRRAIHLHEAAKIIVDRYQGAVPEKKELLLQLPGIGFYTAHALLSFAFNKPYAVVDGNIYRLLSRFFYDPTPINTQPYSYRHYQELADCLLKFFQIPSRYFNFVLLDIGNAICQPRKVLCDHCPLSNWCQGRHRNDVLSLPRKKRKSKEVPHRYFFWYHIKKDRKYLVEQRQGNTFWNGLYTLPLIETSKEAYRSRRKDVIYEGKHVFSHFIMHYKVCIVEELIGVGEKNREKRYFWMNYHQLASSPVPSPMRKFLKEIQE